MSTEFDRKAAAWVRKHYPDAGEVVLGSVEFLMDTAAYLSGGWSNFNVEWTENVHYHTVSGQLPSGQRIRSKTIDDNAWQYDATALLRELVEMEDPGD